MAVTRKTTVVVTRKLPPSVESRMGELFDLTTRSDDDPLSRQALEDAFATADVVVPTITDPIDAALIGKAGPNLKLIANYGAGVDHIDLEAATARGILVTNTPNVLTEDTADMAMSLILAGPRRLVEGASFLANQPGSWQGWSPTWMLGQRIHGKKLGIIGMGRIGTAVAKRARAFGLHIHYHNRVAVPGSIHTALNATYWDDLDEMLKVMDFVSIHCPHTSATHHLLDAKRLRSMAPNAYLVNTARGPIVEEKALIECLQDGLLAGAALDVFDREPQVNPALVALASSGRAILLPHMSSSTLESRVEMGEKVMINIRMLFDGDRPPDRVLPTKRYDALRLR